MMRRRKRAPQCHRILAADLSGDGFEAKCWMPEGHTGMHEAPGFYPRLIFWQDEPFPRIRLFRWLPRGWR